MAMYLDAWTDDGKLWCYYEATSTSSATTLIYHDNGLATVSAMEVDGEAVTLAKTYTFSTLGEHLVKFTLTDATVLGDTNAGIFRTCNNLRRVYMPDTITTVNRLAFYQNSGVTFVRLSPNITTLGEQAFYQTSALSIEVSLPKLTSIDRGCFQGSAITKVTNLGKITSLPNSTIRSTSITDLVLPATLTELVDASIYGNSSLKSVICYASTPPTRNSNVFNGSTLDWIKVMPSSVNTYKSSSYWSSFSSKIYPLWEEGAISLNHLSLGDFRRRIMMGISEENKIVPALDGKVWAYYDVNDTSAATKLFGNTTGIPSTIEIDGVSVSRVTNYTFLTTGIHLVKFTPTTTYVGRGTFHTIPRLKELYLPAKITRTDGANENTASIRNCAILDTLGLPDTFTETRVCDITSLPLLTTMDVSKLTIVGNYSFQRLPLWMPELNMPELTTLRYRPFINAGITKIKSLGTITSLPGGANSINAPFLGCQQLTEVTLPATVTNISTFSFYNCPKLKTLTMLASTPPTLGNSAFRGTTALTTIYVPAGSISAYEAANNWSYWTGKYQEIS